MADADPRRSVAVSLSVLVADVAHDLRNHLNDVSAAEQLLRADGNLDAQQRRALQHIRTGGERTAAIVEALVDLARIDSGRYVVEALPLDIRTVRQIVETALPETPVSVDGVALEHQVLLDPFAFRHALRAEHAVRPRGQRVTIEAAGRQTRLSLEADAAPGAAAAALALALPERLCAMLRAQALPAGRHGWSLLLDGARAA